jgi:Flp pilus assembly protein TadD
MTAKRFVRGLVIGACAVMMMTVAAPAWAQLGTLHGRVVDEKGQPVADVVITLDFVGGYTRHLETKTDSKGIWLKTGLPSGDGTWTITAKKGDLGGLVQGIQVQIGKNTAVADIVITPGGGTPGGSSAGMTQEQVEKHNAQQKALEQLFNDANAAFDAGDYDTAISKLTEMSTQLDKCAPCEAKLGDAYVKKGDNDAAEKAYLQAIEFDPTQPGPYDALATIYNGQKKFDDAAKMSAKANELRGAAGGAGDATSVYNQGIILWNQNKFAEAKTQFAKAVELDPKMADAQYWLGMALVNSGDLANAKKPLEEYLKLAPTGQYAETAKALLASIKN